MEPIALKVARIGNSRGVRLPATTLERFGIGDSVLMEERSDGILLRPVKSGPVKLSWADTATAMADAREDWSEWDVTMADGLDAIPWTNRPVQRVAESKPVYVARKPATKRAGRKKK